MYNLEMLKAARMTAKMVLFSNIEYDNRFPINYEFCLEDDDPDYREEDSILWKMIGGDTESYTELVNSYIKLDISYLVEEGFGEVVKGEYFRHYDDKEIDNKLRMIIEMK